MAAGATTLADITSADWSVMLDSTAGSGAGSGLGNVVQGIADVAQCIAIILTTPKGSDPLRPTFGADLWSFIDYPVNAAIPATVAEVTAALTQWEPRIKLLSVAIAPRPGELAGLEVTVVWQLNVVGAPSLSQTTVVTLSGGA